MPFIRYDIGDVIMSGNGKCRCGRNTDMIESIQGRISDLITDRYGLFTPLQIDQIFRGLHGIAAYRFVQQAKDCYRISIMKDASPEKFDKQILISRCRSMFGDEGHFDIEFVEAIPPQVSKKFRFVYSDIPTPTL
jgi:phenylacetate-CoA ligase